MLFDKFIKTFFYDIQSENIIDNTFYEIREKTKFDIIIIFCAIIPLISINQEILTKNLKLIYSDIYK